MPLALGNLCHLEAKQGKNCWGRGAQIANTHSEYVNGQYFLLAFILPIMDDRIPFTFSYFAMQYG